MPRIHRIPAALFLTGATLVGGSGLAYAEPPLPPALVSILDAASSAAGISVPAADAPRLASVDNFRDVAGTGTGYTTPDGHVNKGVFFRSKALVPNDADLATLGTLGISTVYDLRSDEEIAQKPDVLPQGAAYVHVPILSGDLSGFANITTPDQAREAMRQVNRLFVTGDVERAAFGRLLTSFAETDGAQLFHCTAGKDRTGWTSYLLLSIAGVDPQTIMDDYLLTNEYSRDSIASTFAAIVQRRGEEAAAVYAPILGVEASYLQAGIDQLTADYGTVENYLTAGLGLSGDTIAALKAELVG
ncbi:tyrosine-protein phosphatase [Rhodococcus sp. NPDC003318]|uniref:tyrosine-protein phosphatase n=1 Tax=Rhodococcus sp. NPDC003318 TaxID=3364503 RepID=UPI003686EE6A